MSARISSFCSRCNLSITSFSSGSCWVLSKSVTRSTSTVTSLAKRRTLTMECWDWDMVFNVNSSKWLRLFRCCQHCCRAPLDAYTTLSVSKFHHGASFSHSFALCVWFEKHPEINSPFLNCNLWHDASRLWCTGLPATSLAGLGRSRAATYWCCCGTRSFEFLWVDIDWPSGQALKRPCSYWLVH